MICHQVTLSGDAEWPKVADAVIEAAKGSSKWGGLNAKSGTLLRMVQYVLPGNLSGPPGDLWEISP